MTTEDVSSRIEKSLAPVKEFQDATKKRVESVQGDTQAIISIFIEDIDIRLGREETFLVSITSNLVLSAQHHLNRAWFHASPGFVAIIAAVIKAVGIIVKIVKALIDSQVFQIILSIHKITYALWPDYRRTVNKFLGNISDVAKALGIGLDGFTHIMNAAQSATGFIHGITGGADHELEWQIWQEYETRSVIVAKWLETFQYDPANALSLMFRDGKMYEYKAANEWWTKLSNTMTGTLTSVQEVTTSIAKVTTDLSKLEMELPAFIRDNIPQSIWDGINRADSFINGKILPTLETLDRKFTEIDNILDHYKKHADELVDKIGHPGDLMLGVDDLPDYAREAQLAMIDDVTSRKYAEATAADSAMMSDTIDQLSYIRDVLSEPTPAPEILEIETPARRELMGIVEEPRETWFVGDY